MERLRTPRLSLDLLRGFRVAARQLSFTRAARELSVTQPAISREIRTLEEQLGVPLFRRVNRALQLTQAGAELYRAVDEALALIDGATERLAGSSGALAITTTTALASLWLVPKLPGFARAHPDIDVRIAASNDMVDLRSEHLDIAIRFVLPGGDVPNGERLVDYKQFPVISPQLARSRARPLRSIADLSQHVLLDFETILYGRPWYDWERWLHAMRIRAFRPAGTMRFSHYDQVIRAAVEGGGVAIGKWPHLAAYLREGIVHAPLGRDFVASLGSFYIVVTPGAAERSAVRAFVAWLKEEVRREGEQAPEIIREAASARRRRAATPHVRPRT